MYIFQYILFKIFNIYIAFIYIGYFRLDWLLCLYLKLLSYRTAVRTSCDNICYLYLHRFHIQRHNKCIFVAISTSKYISL